MEHEERAVNTRPHGAVLVGLHLQGRPAPKGCSLAAPSPSTVGFGHNAEMPYSPHHKEQTRQRILSSARKLFASLGYDGTSIEDVMLRSGLTRGAFYKHFSSKAHLHREAMADAAQRALPADPRLMDNWAEEILCHLEASSAKETVLSGEWSFLATDIKSALPEVRDAYTDALRQLVASAAAQTGDRSDAFAQVALVVGILAITGTVDDEALRLQFLSACRQRILQASEVLEPKCTDLLWCVH